MSKVEDLSIADNSIERSKNGHALQSLDDTSDNMGINIENLDSNLGNTNGHNKLNGLDGATKTNAKNPARVVNTAQENMVNEHDNSPDRHGTNDIRGRNEANGIIPARLVNGGREDNVKDYKLAPPPIAIVGMGMRLPGGVNGGSDFWDLLVNKKNGRCVIPSDRYNVDAFYSSSGKPGTVKTQHGYFLEDADLQDLDASFFSMNKKEVEQLDPQQRMLLEVVWECMENGGQVGWRGKNIGCYIGVFGEDWLDLAAKDTQNHGMYRITGSGDFAIANRISYEYNLKGPR